MTEMLSRGAIAPAAPFVDAVDDVLTCVAIEDVTHDVRSFTFELPGRAQLYFLPGQYLTFTFPMPGPVAGEAVERCYTISSPPSRAASVTITVKRVPGGPVSNWLHDEFRVGDRVCASGPFGEFSTAHHPAAKYVFFSAGSGITPLMSMTRTLLESAVPTDVVFVHSARTPADIIFRDELDRIGARPDMSVAVICEGDAPGAEWHGPRGRLSLPLLRTLVPDLCEREAFTCGPPPYMAAVRGLLDAAGLDPTVRHEESFTIGALPPAVEGAGEETGRRFRVEFRRSGRVLECDGGTTLLDGALDAGLTLPSSCGEGVCGTCKLTLLSGRVDMRHAGGIRPREIAQDKILICCSTPLDDVVVDA